MEQQQRHQRAIAQETDDMEETPQGPSPIEQLQEMAMISKRRILAKNDELPQEVCREVLTRLPVRTLLRFRGVCKAWRSEIDNPDFFSTNPLILTVFHGDARVYSSLPMWNTIRVSPHGMDGRFSTSKPRDELPGAANIEGYLNGLMLLYTWHPRSEEGLALYNPSTRKSLKLPPCPLETLRENWILFGFDPSSVGGGDNYKVAVLQNKGSQAVIFDSKTVSWRTKKGKGSQAVIFDSKKGSWRTKKLDYPVPRREFSRLHLRRVYWQGAVHWILEHTDLLLTFNFGTETFSRRGLPSCGSSGRRCNLFLLGESLAVFDVREGEWCIWKMDKYDQSSNCRWTVWYTGVSDCRLPLTTGGMIYVEKSGIFFLDTKSQRVSFFHIESNTVKENLSLYRADFMDTYVENQG